MWSDTADALYALPGCATLTPMASVKVNGRLASDFTLEFLATSATASTKPRVSGAVLSQDSVNHIARAVARQVATFGWHPRREARFAELPCALVLHGCELVSHDPRVVH